MHLHFLDWLVCHICLMRGKVRPQNWLVERSDLLRVATGSLSLGLVAFVLGTGLPEQLFFGLGHSGQERLLLLRLKSVSDLLSVIVLIKLHLLAQDLMAEGQFPVLAGFV